MSNLINDGSLVGFWPFNEPSGAPFFKNYSPAYGQHPSGLSFDLHVNVADVPNVEEMQSNWPGTETVFNESSGTFYTGYRVDGTWVKNSDQSSPHSRHLLCGGGGRVQQEQFLAPAIAQSGFTAGGWLYANSDGYFNLTDANDLNLASYGWIHGISRAHGLFGLFAAGTANGGWRIGLSGVRSKAAQFNGAVADKFEEGEELRAYVALESTGVSQDYLETPIESGTFVHIGFTFRYIDGTSNEIVLYKNGRVAASGTTSDDITLDNSALLSASVHRPFGVGHSNELTAGTTSYPYTSGWGNLVSGVYFFRRVLHEGEMADLHDAGGLQDAEAYISPTKEITIDDTFLTAYYPFYEPGFVDVSRHHRPLIGKQDLGDASTSTVAPGPHGFGGGVVTVTNQSHTMAATSGLCYDIINGRSWTIGGWFAPENSVEREDNIVMSWGSTTTLTNAQSLPISTPPSLNTMGLVVTVSGQTNDHRVVAELYPLGDVTAIHNEIMLANASLEYYDYGAMHIALAYDDATKGVALYINGLQQVSGTLAHSLTDQLNRVTGSGYPLIFGNGIQDDTTDLNTRGVHLTGGHDVWFGPLFAYGRAMLPSEVRGLASSGISFTQLWRSGHDPRLMGYWPADDFKIGDIIVEDRARVWNEVPGHLVRSDTFAKQERWYDRDHNESTSIFDELGVSRYNQFGANRTLPPELASEGNLGVTSGVYSVMGGGMGTANVADALNARSAIGNLSLRYKPTMEQRDATTQNILGEYILSYEVTPSGDIPSTLFGTTSNSDKPQFNSALHVYGNMGASTADGEVRSFLTSINTGISGSGLAIKFVSRNGTFSAANTVPLVSGEVTYGVPNRILLHGKFDDPYTIQGITAGTTPYTLTLWINGTIVQRRQIDANSFRLWSASTPNSTADDWLLHFGGEPFDENYASQLTTLDSGLGEIYMRDMFVMRGRFDKEEVAALAASGIQSVTVTGFSNEPTKTQVTVVNANLEGYYRFNGFEGGPAHGVQGSGTSDLSNKDNHLLPFAEIKAQRGDNTQGAFYLRAVPGPYEESDLAIRASGFTYSSLALTNNATHLIPPFMASGTGFNSPQNGFSVGFMCIKKDDAATNTFDTMVAYGLLGTTTPAETDVNENRGWVIGQDSAEAMKIVISTGGNLYLNNVANAAQSGQVVCGAFGTSANIMEDLRQFEQHKLGQFNMPRPDSWNHWCWVYDPDDFEVRCYLNGEIIDRKGMKQDPEKWSGPQVPASPDARYLTFYQHSNSFWDFNTTNLNDRDSVITDFFYFSDALTDAEVRYIAQNGIDNAVGTETSGIIGGFVHGQDTVSGIIGGYQQGQDTGSGIIGGYFPASIVSSGLIGGYMSGVVFGDGTIGGWVRGLDIVSGIIGGHIYGLDIGSGILAGHIYGQDVGSGLLGGFMIGGTSASGLIGGHMLGADIGSGIIGGFIIGGLQGLVEFDGNFTVEVMTAQDFDAQLHLLQTTSADFDAKIVIFQDEIGPLVSIETPSQTVSGLAPPFNQYFVGKASGQQGKTITQTKWNFGDFTPAISVAESGNGCYPVQHNFAASGFYIVKFEAIDSDGQHGSATRIVNAASGIEPVILSLSGVPRSGNTALTIDFTTTYDIIPGNTAIVTSLLDFDDGQKTTRLNPRHVYTEPGVFRPIWCVRDSRGVTWCDSLEAGSEVL